MLNPKLLFRCRPALNPRSLFKPCVRHISDEDAERLKLRLKRREYDRERDQMIEMVKQKVSQEGRLKIPRAKDDSLMHNKEVEGVVYKYDLPLENKPIVFRNQLMVIDEEKEMATPTMNLFDELELDKDSSYEQYVIKINQNFNHEVDMYGDVKKAGSASLKVLQFGVPIPIDTLNDKLIMSDLRLHVTFNQDLPGAIENVHPNKFIANLRPVEEFRHTPVIPIPDKDLRELKKKIDARNRQGYFVEIKKDSIYYYAITTFIFVAIAYAFYITNEVSMGQAFEMDKIRLGKYETSKMRDGVGKLDARSEFRMPEQ